MSLAIIEENRPASNVSPGENEKTIYERLDGVSSDQKSVEPECLYSKPIDALDSNNTNCTNGSSTTRGDNRVKQEVIIRSNDSSVSADVPANGTLRRIFRSLSFVKKKETSKNKDGELDSSKIPVVCNQSTSFKKENGTSTLTFNSSRKKLLRTADVPYVTDESSNCKECVCIRYKRLKEHPLGEGVVFSKNWPNAGSIPSMNESSGFNSDDHHAVNDNENRKTKEEVDSLLKCRPKQTAFVIEAHCKKKQPTNHNVRIKVTKDDYREADSTRKSQSDMCLEARMKLSDEDDVSVAADPYPTNDCSYFWGKMSEEEADHLLEGKGEGVFLLREDKDRDQEYFTSFQKLGRTRHARIHQHNYEFSYNFQDRNCYTSDTVCGLIEKYRDTSRYPFVEPMLTRPLERYFSQSKQSFV